MIKGTLKCGWDFCIDEKKLDDMEILDALSEAEENPLMFSKVCKKILGEKQREKLYDHLREETGNVPVEAVVEAVIEIINFSGEEGKNL